jgi:hypothetical protein
VLSFAVSLDGCGAQALTAPGRFAEDEWGRRAVIFFRRSL